MQFQQSLLVLSSVLNGIGILLIVARLASRCIKANSFSGLQFEDYLMIIIAGTFTADMWAINSVATNGSNYMSPEAAAALTPEGVERAIWGSKMTLVLEILTLATEWGCKFCLVILFHKLTNGLEKQPAVKLVGLFCFICFLVITIFFLTLWCTPIQEYWRVPVRHSQCATYYNHMIFATSLNVVCDILLLCIPIPIIVRAQLPLKRRVILVCILGLGLFNILSTVLNRYYNFSNPNNLGYLNWYVGEVATSVYVTNIPLIWPLLRKIFGLRSWSANSTSATPPSGRADFLRGRLAPPLSRRRQPSGESTRALGLESEDKNAAASVRCLEDNSAPSTLVWNRTLDAA